ncbi:MAG: hypothetical protein U5R49_09015 [Deltaproteobacteria bacterium]|nr:hypothetical protein [Deltaproteobacteria bacterium]
MAYPNSINLRMQSSPAATLFNRRSFELSRKSSAGVQRIDTFKKPVVNDQGNDRTNLLHKVPLFPKRDYALFARCGLFFLVLSLIKKRPKHTLASLIWVGIVLWFFNSSFFGFSEVTVGQAGIQLNYGVLSFRNEHLPIDSRWRIKTDFSDIRKLKRVYFMDIAGRESMKLRGETGKARFESIGQAIDRAKEGGHSRPSE